MKKKLYQLITLLSITLLISACDKDGNHLYLSGFESSELIITNDNVVLSTDNNHKIVLSLAWERPTLLSSNAEKPAASNLLKTYLQVASTSDFNESINEINVTYTSKIYTGESLNALSKDLGLESDLSSSLFFRIRSNEGSNMESAYSNVCEVKVTPFTIHMNRLAVLNGDRTETLTSLYSDTENGIYTGYMNAKSWQNCWFRENNGTLWGNSNIDGHTFSLSDASDAWNCWFANGTGHWFVTVDTQNEKWSASYISSITLNDKEMNYDNNLSRWSTVITTTRKSTPIGGIIEALEYNATTGTDDYVNKQLILPETMIATAGTYTVHLYINNHAEYSYDILSLNSSHN